MRGTLSFKLPEEQQEFEEALSAAAYKAALDNFSNYLRSERKYRELNEVQVAYLEEITQAYYNIVNSDEDLV